MRRAGLHALPTSSRRGKPTKPPAVFDDLVKRVFRRVRPNDLWVTDITEHAKREGKLSCCALIDAFLRRDVVWAIDTSARVDLATHALGMAIDSRGHVAPGIIHGDHGTQFTLWAFTERARQAGLLPSLGSVGDPYDNAVAERSGRVCRSNSSTGSDGQPDSNRRMPSFSTSRASTPGTDVTPILGGNAP